MPANRTKESAGNSAQAEKPTSQAPSISLPKGGGATRGTEEAFITNQVTGIGSVSALIASNSEPCGFGTQLSLACDFRAGNGRSGWSRSLSPITRKTDEGFPK